jgi:hypothetical protein
VSRESVSRWFAEWRSNGVPALAPRLKTRHPRSVNDAMWRRRARIGDRLNTHRSAATQAWLRAHDIVNVFLPTDTRELNLDERCTGT